MRRVGLVVLLAGLVLGVPGLVLVPLPGPGLPVLLLALPVLVAGFVLVVVGRRGAHACALSSSRTCHRQLDRLWLADHDPTITGIATQPLQLTGRDGSASRSHVPDVLLVHADGAVTVVVVRPAAFVPPPPDAVAAAPWRSAAMLPDRLSGDRQPGRLPVAAVTVGFPPTAQVRA